MDYIEVGYSSKSFGVKGELKCIFHEHYLEDVLKAPALFFCINGHYLPYFSEEIYFDQFFRLKLEAINSKEETKPLHNKPIYLRKMDIKELIADNERIEWIGFLVIDLNTNQEIGLIKEIHELPEQILAELLWKDKSVFIPMHQYLIEDLDRTKKIIKMRLAEGLLDL